MLTNFQKELLADVADNLRMQQFRMENVLLKIQECDERNVLVEALSETTNAKVKLEQITGNHNGRMF